MIKIKANRQFLLAQTEEGRGDSMISDNVVLFRREERVTSRLFSRRKRESWQKRFMLRNLLTYPY